MPEKDLSILFVPFGTQEVAASRYRVFQYLPYLKSQNIKCKVFSIISRRTTRRMIMSPAFGKLKKTCYYLHLVWERIFRFIPLLILARKYKVVLLQRTTFPFGLERLLRRLNPNIIFDLDDAIFIPDTKESGLIGRLKEYSKAEEVANILKVSKLAIVENEYIRNYVRQHCANITLIPGPIDTVRYFIRPKAESGVEVVIGWIGSPSTTLYLAMLDAVFQELALQFKIRVKLIGAGEYYISGVNVINLDWSYETEVGQLQTFDIGVMPMPDNEWTRGKLGCKMLQYMAVGVPAVVSYTLTNAEVIEDGKSGFLARTKEDWMEKLSLLIKDAGLRQRSGFQGRKAVEERFSLEVNAPKFKEILEKNFAGYEDKNTLI